jgi:hypothetical protein
MQTNRLHTFHDRQQVPPTRPNTRESYPSDGAQKVAAAQARRARRNAKRLADAEALAATASAAATPWPNPPYVAGQTFFDGHIDWTFYERRQEWIGVTRTKQARRNAKRAREAAKVGA